MATEWYCRIKGKQYGPLRSNQLLDLARSGALSPADLVRRGCGGAWTKAAKVKGLELSEGGGAHSVSRWYCRVGAQTLGPLSSQQLRAAARSGRLSPADLVRSVSRKTWVPAARVRGLEFPGSARAQPQPDKVMAASSHPTETHDAKSTASEPAIPNSLPRRWSSRLGLKQFSRTIRHVVKCTGASLRHWLRGASSTSASSVGRTSYGKTIALAALCIVPFVLPTFGPALHGPVILVLTAVAVLIGTILYGAVCRPDGTSRGWALFAFLFTALFGATTLLQFVDLATGLAQQDVSWQHAPLWLVKALGSAYNQATVPPADSLGAFSVLLSLLSTIVSVGLCEEGLKLIPAVVAVGTGHVMSRRGAMFIGAMSGLAFGTSESLWVSFEVYLPDHVPLSMYLTRCFGCVFAHAAITLVASSFLVVKAPLRDNAAARCGWRFVVVALLCTVAAAVVHGFYDTCLSHGMPGLAGLTMAVVVWGVIVIDERTPA
ncbi:MAG: DUF4339 domain-containing protein [Planctomycetes bacterium]|nr:DUF4339 domain-containing protein [Planctomycetota bacterium]